MGILGLEHCKRRDVFQLWKKFAGTYFNCLCIIIVELTDKATEDKNIIRYLFEMLIKRFIICVEGVDPEVLSLIIKRKCFRYWIGALFDTCAICHQETDFVAFSALGKAVFCCSRVMQSKTRIGIPVGEAGFIN